MSLSAREIPRESRERLGRTRTLPSGADEVDQVQNLAGAWRPASAFAPGSDSLVQSLVVFQPVLVEGVPLDGRHPAEEFENTDEHPVPARVLGDRLYRVRLVELVECTCISSIQRGVSLHPRSILGHAPSLIFLRLFLE